MRNMAIRTLQYPVNLCVPGMNEQKSLHGARGFARYLVRKAVQSC